MNESDEVTILLVEDDEVDARAVKRAFKQRNIGNPIVHARDGVEALEHLKGTEGRPRLPRPYLILLDLNMPRMNGLEFLTTIRADSELKNSIVIVLTTSDDDRDVVRAYGSGVAGYVLKSESGDEFLKIAQFLEHFVITVHFPPQT